MLDDVEGLVDRIGVAEGTTALVEGEVDVDGVAVVEGVGDEVAASVVEVPRSVFFATAVSRVDCVAGSVATFAREFPTCDAIGRSLLIEVREDAYGVFGGTGPAVSAVLLSRFCAKLLPTFCADAELGLMVAFAAVKTTSSLLKRWSTRAVAPGWSLNEMMTLSPLRCTCTSSKPLPLRPD